jgi:hypothetical protein
MRRSLHPLVCHIKELCIHVSRAFAFTVEHKLVVTAISTNNCNKNRSSNTVSHVTARIMKGRLVYL